MPIYRLHIKTTITTLTTVVMMTKMMLLKSELPKHDDRENIDDYWNYTVWKHMTARRIKPMSKRWSLVRMVTPRAVWPSQRQTPNHFISARESVCVCVCVWRACARACVCVSACVCVCVCARARMIWRLLTNIWQIGGCSACSDTPVAWTFHWYL